jgi:hypothetical protein
MYPQAGPTDRFEDGRMLATLANAHRRCWLYRPPGCKPFTGQNTSELLKAAGPSAFAQALAQLPPAFRSEGLL